MPSIIKEIAIYKSGVLSSNIFNPPYSFNALSPKCKQQVNWLRHNFHGLFWYDGDIPYDRVKEIIHNELVIKNIQNSIVYVKGTEKVKWLWDNCKVSSINIESFENCPKLKAMINYPINMILNGMSHAQKNVMKMFGWYNLNY